MGKPSMLLGHDSVVAVIGAGPAGSLSSYFLLEMAQRLGHSLRVEIYDPKDFGRHGPAGCNHCGGLISESLAQLLAAEGINLPPSVVQRGIDTYVFHAPPETFLIKPAVPEQRIAAIYRGLGPAIRGRSVPWESFDGFLLKLAIEKGAVHRRSAVTGIEWVDERPVVTAHGRAPLRADLVIVASGANGTGASLLQPHGLLTRPPVTARASIAEIHLGADPVRERFGSAMHIFMPALPGVAFAAIIPKEEHLTACLIGPGITSESMPDFLRLPEVRDCLRFDGDPPVLACRCLPHMNIRAGSRLYGNRMVAVGDCGVSRLYKDGIGAAYRMAKACAVTAIFHGVSATDFHEHYFPTCRALQRDNRLGRMLFAAARIARRPHRLRRALAHIVADEQTGRTPGMALSSILWDLFTGSASYREVGGRAMQPALWWKIASTAWHDDAREQS